MAENHEKTNPSSLVGFFPRIWKNPKANPKKIIQRGCYNISITDSSTAKPPQLWGKISVNFFRMLESRIMPPMWICPSKVSKESTFFAYKPLQKGRLQQKGLQASMAIWVYFMQQLRGSRLFCPNLKVVIVFQCCLFLKKKCTPAAIKYQSLHALKSKLPSGWLSNPIIGVYIPIKFLGFPFLEGRMTISIICNLAKSWDSISPTWNSLK